MTKLFIDLTANDVLDKVADLADEYEVVEEVIKDVQTYVAYLNGGWLSEVYPSEDEAYRAILAEIVGKKTLFEG